MNSTFMNRLVTTYTTYFTGLLIHSVDHIIDRAIKCYIREYDSTLYVGMVQGVSNSQYIGIGTSSRKASKTAKTRLRRAKYEIFIH